MTDFELMGAALDEARKAAALGEVPVGAVVARNGQIVAAAHNTRETEKNALHHAELLAIDAACKALGGWRLWSAASEIAFYPHAGRSIVSLSNSCARTISLSFRWLLCGASTWAIKRLGRSRKMPSTISLYALSFPWQ